MDTKAHSDSAPSQAALTAPPAAPIEEAAKEGISVDRYKLFKKFIRKAFDTAGTDELPVSDVTAFVQKEAGNAPFTEEELEAAYSQFTKENKGMFYKSNIILI